MNSGSATIQVQDPTGIWRTIMVVPYRMDNLQQVQKGMESVKNRYPKYRVRATDKHSGGLIDFLF